MHGTVDRYAEGCRCSGCVIAAAKEDAPNVRRLDARGRFTRRPPAPADMARCSTGCGRLVWHFDLGLCGACGQEVAA